MVKLDSETYLNIISPSSCTGKDSASTPFSGGVGSASEALVETPRPLLIILLKCIC